MRLVLVGPSGSGKTTVGRALAAARRCPFLDADDLHDATARAKMASGTPLDDADRAPWLARVHAQLAAAPDLVVACSALRRAYRDTLRAGLVDVRFILLDAGPATLAVRLDARRGHFMPASLLASQLATLERADDLVPVDATRPLDDLIATIRSLPSLQAPDDLGSIPSLHPRSGERADLHRITIELVDTRLEQVDADALLVPVDGQLCRLGGAVANALRLALPVEERADELEYVEHALAQLRPLPHPTARAIDGVARWRKLVVVAAYPHNVDGAVYSPGDCARMLRAAIPSAIAVADAHALHTLAAPLIGTAYRMSADLAVRAFVDGLASAARHRVHVRWSLPDAAHRALASAACDHLGLPLRAQSHA